MFKQVDDFPLDPPEEADNYSFVQARSLDALARTLAVTLKADTITEDAVYFPESTSLPPGGVTP